MISGNKPRKIKKFLYIDRCAEGYGYTKPQNDEEFLGIPYSYYEDSSSPFIEVVRNGTVVRTINCSDISEIEFEDEK
jgi:hypothetical protein